MTLQTIQDGEKRWTSVLSLDLVGFTTLSQNLGSETVYELLQAVLTITKEAITASGGHIVDTAGDGVLASFGAPTALENAPLQACRAADQILSRLIAQSATFEARYSTTPQVRIGVAGGNVMIAHGESGAIKVVGNAVNIAARLQDRAKPNTVLITDDINQEAQGGIQTINPREVHLKGFSHPILSHELQSVLDAKTRFATARNRGTHPLVSRRSELARALATFEPNSQTSSVLISGTAGIGKSRLLHEITTTLQAQRTTLTGQCAPDKTTRPYAPFEAILHGLSELEAIHPQNQHLTAIQSSFPGSCSDAGISRFCLPRSEEQDPVGRILHDRSFLVELLTSVARQAPYIFVFEDLHWADANSLTILGELASAKVPVIATTREVDDTLLTPDINQIALQPLNDLDIATLVGQLSPQTLSPALSDRLVERAEGNPLVAEEIAYALRANKNLHETDEGLALNDGSEMIVSGNLQQLVLSRVDQLAPEQKAVLQVASAIGRDFDLAVLRKATKTPLGDVNAFGGIITQLDEATGRFSHALVREAVYNGLLTAHRKDIHLTIATTLSDQNPITSFANLAHHYVSAVRPDKAAPVLVKAGQEALQSYDLLLTDTLLSQAFQMAVDDPKVLNDTQFAKLAMLWTRALSVNGNYGRMMQLSKPLQRRLEQCAYSSDRSVSYALIALAQTGARDYAGARDLLIDTIKDANANSDAYGAAWAKTTLARIYDETAWAPQKHVRELCRDVVEVAEASGDRHLYMSALYLIVASYRACGRRQKALEATDAMEEMAEKYQDRRARGYANSARALLFTIVGEPETATTYLVAAQNDFLPHTTDSRVIIGIRTFTEIFTTPPADVWPKVHRMNKVATELVDYNLIHAYAWIHLVLELRSGSLTDGWRMANQLVFDMKAGQNVNLMNQIHMTRAEFLLAVAGLIDPDAEGPPDRPKFPRKRPTIKDLATFVRLKFTAKSLAKNDFLACLEIDQEGCGVNFARAHIGLGLIAAARKQTAKAKEHLERGLKFARQEEVTILINRAESALERL